MSKEFPDRPVELHTGQLNTLISQHPLVVVDCWAPWCVYCSLVEPTIDALAKDYAGRVVFVKFNIDEDVETAMKYGIMALPNILVFKNGALLDQRIGVQPREKIEYMIRKQLG